MREFALYVCEIKGPDQLMGNHTPDQRLSFRYIDITNTLLHESEISNLRPSALSVSVLVGVLERRFSRDAAQICLIFLLQKDLMTAYNVACVRSCSGLTSSLIIKLKSCLSFLLNENPFV